MNIRILFSAVLLPAIFLLPTTNAVAQKKQVPTPKLILVRLPTYTDKIALCNKANNKSRALQAAIDAKEMRKAIIADFNENFTFCSYYFFDDTSSKKIINKDFTGILFDKDMTPLISSPISKDDTTYQIAYFGHYLSASDESSEYTTGSSIQRLVLVDYMFRRIPDKAPNGKIYGEGPIPLSLSKQRVYQSPQFDIYYIRFAKEMSKAMQRYYNNK